MELSEIKNGEKLWNDLVVFLEGELHDNNESDIILQNKDKWTNFFTKELPKKIIENFNRHSDVKLEIEEKEYLRVDVTIYTRGKNGFHVPIIFIESENKDNDGTLVEIHKLCSLNAPLKLLFLRYSYNYQEVSEEKNNWWDYIIPDFIEITNLVGYLGIISVERKDNEIKFHCLAINDSGNQLPVKIISVSSTLPQNE